jgi:predicted GH43/DUF377 family glycosyl hydrolase
MYASARAHGSIMRFASADGVNWTNPKHSLSHIPWARYVNRPCVLYHDGVYHMWFTGQGRFTAIGYAISHDGVHFAEVVSDPVLVSTLQWERPAVMCPHVIWDGGKFKMWYSGGQVYEPDAIGYAESADGLNWTKRGDPVFAPNVAMPWESHKVTACQVVRRERDYLMFYIGFRDVNTAAIGMAKSEDGIGGWVRFGRNPIVFPTPGDWDGEACYKPFALLVGGRWMLWYNGRREHTEQIGLAVLNSPDLGF